MGKETDKEKFNVTEEHMKLLKQMWVSWDECEFGAPGIEPKRPYMFRSRKPTTFIRGMNALDKSISI